jgi:hypothetical protein
MAEALQIYLEHILAKSALPGTAEKSLDNFDFDCNQLSPKILPVSTTDSSKPKHSLVERLN